jgi:choline dehydrogenase
VQSDDALRDYIRLSLDTYYHPVGTCKIGRDRLAVVDPQLRVHGIDKLRIADASVFPTIPSGNTHAPSVMVGERAADFVIGEVMGKGSPMS